MIRLADSNYPAQVVYGHRLADTELFVSIGSGTLARALRCGSVAVNAYADDAHDMTVPFGGYKQSGFGRDKSLHALDKYTQLKTTWVKL